MVTNRSSSKGGRPKIQQGRVRTKVISTRLTATEWFLINNKVKASGKKASAFTRELLLTGQVVAPHSQKIIHLIGSLSQGLNNLNQLTHLAHLNGLNVVIPLLNNLYDFFSKLRKDLKR